MGDAAEMMVGSAVEVTAPVAVPVAAPDARDAIDTPSSAVTAGDLAELMSSFNEVTRRLEATHTVLRGEVSRLTQELGEANARLRRSERLAELGQMAAGIAHEIRNPLGSISLYSEMLTEDLRGLEAEESAETARKIGSSVRRLDAIVRDVLDFARDLVIRPEAIDAGDLLAAAVESPRFDQQFSAHNSAGPDAAITVEPGAESVYCDSSLGLQALLNIVENARQANLSGPAGASSVIEVFAKPCRVRTSPDESVPGVAVGVRDRGPGIEPGVIERMFNPFFTTRETGTGLGLAIVHRIVDAHDGSVVVRNNTESGEPDGRSGVTVELRFPSVRVGGSAGEFSVGSVGDPGTERQA